MNIVNGVELTDDVAITFDNETLPIYDNTNPKVDSVEISTEGYWGVFETDFYYNYYDTKIKIRGGNFNANCQVYYQATGGGTVYQSGVGDGEAVPTFVSLSMMKAWMNFIGLPVGTYNLWVADPTTDPIPTDSAGRTLQVITVKYGPPRLLAQGAGNVTIRSRRSSSVYQSIETSGATAFLRSGAQCKFKLIGMGFFDISTGMHTNVNIGTSGNLNGNYYATIDRATKSVLIYCVVTSSLADWNNKGSTFFTWTVSTVTQNTNFNIIITNDPPYGSNVYTGRWRETLSTNPPAWT